MTVDVERILECSRKALGEQALVAYEESCVRILHRNINCLGLPMVTIGLAQGDALGGGFESLLSFNVIIAERGAKFGWPRKIGCKPWRSRLSRSS
jgi:enoyl-CoA hydratase/carnithine racemase